LTVRKISEPKSESNKGSSARTSLIENGQDDKVQIAAENVGDNTDEDNNAENCNVSSSKIDDEAKSTNPLDKVQKVQYGLSAVVCYVDDKNNEERRNIVALLRVGPGYHVRSTGNAVSQWYIFNDFW